MTSAATRPVLRRPVREDTTFARLQDVDPILRRVYAARGVTDPGELDYGLCHLAPVGSMPNIDAAVQLLLEHRERRIVVVGDFDADGATSTALVIRCLRDFGVTDVSYLVPNRFDYGYGLTPEIVDVAAERAPDLLITVDNGVSSIDGVAAAKRRGIRVLVTDHHLPGAVLPQADVILNPNLGGSDFGSPHLAGVGVAFYLMAGVGRALQQQGLSGAARMPARYLDLVALGTVADVVRLDHNNRILVRQGLDRIRAGACVAGIDALFACSGRPARRAVSTDLGFAVAPRLNAAGRLNDMSVGIECLLTDNAAAAAELAASLDHTNRQRRDIETGMRERAFAFVDAIDARNLPDCVCVYDADWHPGIVGLVAARVRERCNRPVVAFAREGDGKLKGSARSIPGVHIRDVLEAVSARLPAVIEKFGGHAMAAGLTLDERAYGDFAEAAAEQVGRLYPDADFSGALLTDGELDSDLLSLGFARTLREAGPWGAGFPEPVFCNEFEIVDMRIVGTSHLKMRLKPTDGTQTVDAIAFNQADEIVRGVVRLAYRLDVNDFRGLESPQLVVEHIVT